MTIREILEFPDPRLQQLSDAVDTFDASVAECARDLLETLGEAGGIGLSAPQIGDLRRIVVLDLSEDRSAPEIYVNPEVIARRAFGFIEESCLSLPGVTGTVMRSAQVCVRACSVDGEPFERELENLHACAIQHEIDHLDGKLFVDRFSLFGRWRFNRGAGARLRSEASASDD